MYDYVLCMENTFASVVSNNFLMQCFSSPANITETQLLAL